MPGAPRSLHRITVRSFGFPIDRAHAVTADELVDLHGREIRDETRVLVLTDVDNIVDLRLPLAAIAAAMWAHAVDFQVKLGREAVAAHRDALRAYARERVDADPRLQWRSPETGPLASGLHAVGAGDFDGRDVARRLFEEHQVVVRGFIRRDLRCLRVSPNVSDTEADLDRFFEALDAVLD